MIKKTVAFLLVAVFSIMDIGKAYNGAFDKLPEIGAKQQSPITLKADNEEGLLILKMMHLSDIVVEDAQLREYTDRLIKTLSQAANFKKQNILPILTNDFSFNASALPGSVIMVNLGLFIYLQNHDQLAFVLAHELAHIKLKVHSFASEKAWDLLATWALILGGAAILDSVVSSGTRDDSNVTSSIAYAGSISGFFSAYEKLLCYSRQDENEADQIGIDIIIKAGYSPRASVDMFRLLQKSTSIGNIPEFLLTHPYVETRIVQATNRVIQFEEYNKKMANSYAKLPEFKLNNYANLQTTDKKIKYGKLNSYNLVMASEQKDEFFLMQVRAQLLAPEQSSILNEVINGKIKSNGVDSLSIAEKYALAIFKLNNNKLKEADSLIKGLIKDRNINSHFAILQSQIYQAMGDLEKSQETISNALLLKPNSYPLLVEQFKILDLLKNNKESLKSAKKICEIKPLYPSSWKYLSQAQSNSSDKIHSYISMAESFYLSGMFIEARKQLYQAKELKEATSFIEEQIDNKLKEIEQAEKKINKI